MNRRLIRIELLLLALALFAAPAQALTYTATLLHPAGVHTFGEAAAAGSQVGHGYSSTRLDSHALLWHDTPASEVDLNPVNLATTWALGVSNDKQIGYGTGLATNYNAHALLWSGTAASYIDLNPPGYVLSYGYAISGSRQGGTGRPQGSGSTHAILWSGTAASAIDLHPAGFDTSAIFALSDTNQAGVGFIGRATHALVWSGTAQSVVDLNGPGLTSSFAQGAFGTSQVGDGVGPATDNQTHALLWRGTSDSMVDLNPPDFKASLALAVNGDYQVGHGQSSAAPSISHALVWNGTANSAVDLHAYLNGLAPTLVQSFARGISENGSIVGYAFDQNMNSYAVLWTPIPEPSSSTLAVFSILFASALARLSFDRRNRRVTLLTR
jgi:hypothetical protein